MALKWLLEQFGNAAAELHWTPVELFRSAAGLLLYEKTGPLNLLARPPGQKGVSHWRRRDRI
jgi:hypothetical protein